jgi:hypothetical protein
MGIKLFFTVLLRYSPSSYKRATYRKDVIIEVKAELQEL